MKKEQLKKLGFQSPNDRATLNRIIMSISGLEKQGKTHFALTAPGPIAIFSTDIGDEGVVEKVKGKEIQILDVARVGNETPVEEAAAEFERFKTAYTAILRDGDFKTIVLDTATEIWELLRMARFGKLTQVMPYQYGPVNAEYRHLIRDAYGYDKNLILLHKMKPMYVNDKRTADYERAGFGDTGFLVQVNAEVYRYSRDDGGDFAIYIKDCRQNQNLAEEEFVGEMCNFPMIACMVIEGTDPSDWE